MQACHLLTGSCPFRDNDEDSKINVAHHLADMIGLMGDPPLEFLQRSEDYLQYWDEKGMHDQQTVRPGCSLMFFDRDFLLIFFTARMLAGSRSNTRWTQL